MRTCLAFIALLALAAVGRADDSMVKIVFRQDAPDIVPGSYASLPKTLYRYEADKGRVEQALDPEHHVQQLYIANHRDAWIIDLVSKTGRHMVDLNPDDITFNAPIVPATEPGKPPPARAFELGDELVFVRSQHVAPKTVTRHGKKMVLYECVVDGYTIRLYLSTDKPVPLQSEVLKDGKLVVSLIYLEYSHLPLNSSLFVPPADVKITEAQ